MSSTFKKVVEDFTCGHCGAVVIGNGFTDHCPTCLWSKHVDVFPGDRASTCGGMMEPVSFRVDHGESDILNRCQVCGHEKWNVTAPEDDREKILKLSVAPLP